MRRRYACLSRWGRGEQKTEKERRGGAKAEGGMMSPALSLSRSPLSSVSSSPLHCGRRSAAAVRRHHGPSFAYKPAAGVCYASHAVESLPSLCPEIVVRDARLEDCWEVADTHCSSFFPDYKFPLDLALRIDRYIASLSGFSVPPRCKRTCLVAVNSNSVNNSFNIKCGDPRDAGFQKYNLSRGSIAGILRVDTVADYLPRRGPRKQRRTGIAYVANVAVRKEEHRKGIAKCWSKKQRHEQGAGDAEPCHCIVM